MTNEGPKSIRWVIEAANLMGMSRRVVRSHLRLAVRDHPRSIGKSASSLAGLDALTPSPYPCKKDGVKERLSEVSHPVCWYMCTPNTPCHKQCCWSTRDRHSSCCPINAPVICVGPTYKSARHAPVITECAALSEFIRLPWAPRRATYTLYFLGSVTFGFGNELCI